jgi:hypothetical protein
VANPRRSQKPHSVGARLLQWDRVLLRLSLALHCSPISLETLPLARLQAMLSELNKQG